MIATRLMQTAEPDTALEQSWLLAELHERFGMSLQELARSFSKDVTEALLSRLRHQCQTIHINGPSLREPTADCKATQDTPKPARRREG